jgi:hypothetical protein
MFLCPTFAIADFKTESNTEVLLKRHLRSGMLAVLTVLAAWGLWLFMTILFA